MKVYVWYLESLKQYYAGAAIAVAESKEEAILQLMEKEKDLYKYLIYDKGPEILKELRNTEPEIYSLPWGCLIYGGE